MSKSSNFIKKLKEVRLEEEALILKIKKQDCLEDNRFSRANNEFFLENIVNTCKFKTIHEVKAKKQHFKLKVHAWR